MRVPLNKLESEHWSNITVMADNARLVSRDGLAPPCVCADVLPVALPTTGAVNNQKPDIAYEEYSFQATIAGLLRSVWVLNLRSYTTIRLSIHSLAPLKKASIPELQRNKAGDLRFLGPSLTGL